jgi:hypothetical protein
VSFFFTQPFPVSWLLGSAVAGGQRGSHHEQIPSCITGCMHVILDMPVQDERPPMTFHIAYTDISW